MKKLLSVALFLTAVVAQAQTYGEIGYLTTKISANVDDGSLKATPKAVRAILGYELHPNAALEGMVALGSGGSTLKVNGTTVPNSSVKVSSYYGLFLKPKAKLSDQFEIFGRVGYGKGKLKIRDEIESETTSASRIAYGFGASYSFTSQVALTGDFMHYSKKEGVKTTGFTMGLRYQF